MTAQYERCEYHDSAAASRRGDAAGLVRTFGASYQIHAKCVPSTSACRCAHASDHFARSNELHRDRAIMRLGSASHPERCRDGVGTILGAAHADGTCKGVSHARSRDRAGRWKCHRSADRGRANERSRSVCAPVRGAVERSRHPLITLMRAPAAKMPSADIGCGVRLRRTCPPRPIRMRAGFVAQLNDCDVRIGRNRPGSL